MDYDLCRESKAATTNNFHPKRNDGKDIQYLTPNVSDGVGVNAKHHSYLVLFFECLMTHAVATKAPFCKCLQWHGSFL